MNITWAGIKLVLTWILILIIAVAIWPITLLYLSYLLYKFLYNKYYDLWVRPEVLLDAMSKALEDNNKKYKEIIRQHEDNIIPLEPMMLDLVQSYIKNDIQLGELIRTVKVKERFNKKKLRETFVYISDYMKLQGDLIQDHNLEENFDLKTASKYLEMQEIIIRLNSFSTNV